MKWSVSSAEFLSYLENITVEETEDVKEIEIDRTDPCFYLYIRVKIHVYFYTSLQIILY